MLRLACSFSASFLIATALSSCGDDVSDSTDSSMMVDSGRRDSTSGCDPACPEGTGCCGGVAGAFCRDFERDPENCGDCGVRCTLREFCVSGVCLEGDAGAGACIPDCTSNELCCGAACVSRDGSPIDPVFRREDASYFNCGGCGMVCETISTSECMPLAMGDAPQCLCGGLPPCEPPTSCVLLGGGWTCAAP